jgi:hypothetical protein
MLFDVYVSLLPAQRQTVRVEAGCTRQAILAAMHTPEVDKAMAAAGQVSLIVSAFRAVPKAESGKQKAERAGEGLRLSA